MSDIIDTTIKMDVVEFQICDDKPGNIKGRFLIERKDIKGNMAFNGKFLIKKE